MQALSDNCTETDNLQTVRGTADGFFRFEDVHFECFGCGHSPPFLDQRPGAKALAAVGLDGQQNEYPLLLQAVTG